MHTTSSTPLPLACTHLTTWWREVWLLYTVRTETWGWFSYFPSQVTAKLDKRQLYNWVWPELRHRHSQSGWRLSEISSYPWYHLWIYCKQSFYPQLQMFMAQMTRSALSAQKIKVCDINYVPSPETRFCFHLCCGELTFTRRQVFTILRLNLVIMWISKNTKFIIFFQWSTSIHPLSGFYLKYPQKM